MDKSIATCIQYDINNINSIYDFIVSIFLFLENEERQKVSGDYNKFIKGNNEDIRHIDTMFNIMMELCDKESNIIICSDKLEFNKFKKAWFDMLQKTDNVLGCCMHTLVVFDNYLNTCFAKINDGTIIEQGPFNEITKDGGLFFMAAPCSYDNDLKTKAHIRLSRQSAVSEPNSLETTFNSYQIIKTKKLLDYSIKIKKYNKPFVLGKDINIGIFSSNISSYSELVFNCDNFTINAKYKEDYEDIFVNTFINTIQDLDDNNITIAIFPELSLLPNTINCISKQLKSIDLENIELIFTGSEWKDNNNVAYVLSSNGDILLSHHKHSKFSKFVGDAEYIEDIKYNNCFEFLDIDNFGRIGYMICKDCTGIELNSLFTSIVNVKILFISAYTTQISLMENMAKSNAETLAVTSIMCNTCNNENGNNVLGYVFQPEYNNKSISAQKHEFSRPDDSCCSTTCSKCKKIYKNKYCINVVK